MIKQIRYIRSSQYNPYLNLAFEEHLFENVKEDECILYLWQNEKTVVIGRNQNPWKECKIKELEKDGGHLVRRLSGGGAVFHDLGNLNFTFLVGKQNYDLDKQLEVILLALKNLGIPAEKSGRNDITVKGRKISGNAFYFDKDRCYHHGTLLVNVDMDSLSKYLNVAREKLESKGVDSVKSRVTNLVTHKENLSIDHLVSALVNAFSSVYGLVPEEINWTDLDEEDILSKRDRFASWDWLYGTKIPFIYNITKRFPWGEFEILINANKGKITHCRVFSDAMDVKIIGVIKEVLIDIPFSSKDIVKAIRKIDLNIQNSSKENKNSRGKKDIRKIMIDDICELILNENL